MAGRRWVHKVGSGCENDNGVLQKLERTFGHDRTRQVVHPLQRVSAANAITQTTGEFSPSSAVHGKLDLLYT